MKQFEKIANVIAATGLAAFIILTAINSVIDYPFVENFKNINYYVFGGITLLIMIVKSDIWMNKLIRKFIALQILLFLFVAFFKILHWPNLIVIYLCYLVLMTLYFIRFLKKEEKRFLDILKFLWIVSLSIMTVFKLLHYPFQIQIELLYQIVFWFMIVFYWIDWIRLKTSKI